MNCNVNALFSSFLMMCTVEFIFFIWFHKIMVLFFVSFTHLRLYYSFSHLYRNFFAIFFFLWFHQKYWRFTLFWNKTWIYSMLMTKWIGMKCICLNFTRNLRFYRNFFLSCTRTIKTKWLPSNVGSTIHPQFESREKSPNVQHEYHF